MHDREVIKQQSDLMVLTEPDATFSVPPELIVSHADAMSVVTVDPTSNSNGRPGGQTDMCTD